MGGTVGDEDISESDVTVLVPLSGVGIEIPFDGDARGICRADTTAGVGIEIPCNGDGLLEKKFKFFIRNSCKANFCFTMLFCFLSLF